MPLESRRGSQPRAQARGGFMRLGVPQALDWVLLAYAILAVAAGGAFAALRIHADYIQTLQQERESLRGVTAALQGGALAILDDGVGAGLAAARAVRSSGPLDRLPAAAVSAMLQRELTGGAYVRALFVADRGRFVMASRTRSVDSRAPPAWLRQAAAATGTWVGAPIPDPEDAGRTLIPVARRMSFGPGAVGWAGALFSLRQYEQTFRRLGGRWSGLGLVATDGTVLALVWNNSGNAFVGRNVAHNPVFRRSIQSGRGGIAEGYGALTRRQMIYAYDPVTGFPIYAVAGEDRDSVLAGWRGRRRADIGAAVAFSALVLIMTGFLAHYVRALRARERDYRTLFNNAQFSVFLLEGERFVDANGTVASMFGLASEQDAIGLTPWQLSPPWQPDGGSSRELAIERIATALREGGSTFEWLHKRIDTGETFAAEVDLSSLSTGDTTLALAVVHDVTVRKRAEEDLRHLSAELMRLQDEERRRIGRDLHDSTGQTLAALEIGLSELQRRVSSLPAAAGQRLEECIRLAAQCSAEIRTASYLLHPPLLDELGLLSALRWLADGLSSRSGLEVRLQLPEELQRLTAEEELAFFRVAQEALTNVHRHSSSPWVAIRLRARLGELVLEIEDGGRGIFPSSGADHDSGGVGVGVMGMRERIRELGGSFAIESTSGGTLIRASLPLRRAPSPISGPDPAVLVRS
ncbi:MAG: histidine kinase [Steroidobacteraceae bacterium]